MRTPSVAVQIATSTLEAHRYMYDELPLHAALVDYRDHGHPVGDFLTAVLANDLVEAIGRADLYNSWLLPIYVGFLYNEFPSDAWGSREKVAAWIQAHAERRAQAKATVAP